MKSICKVTNIFSEFYGNTLIVKDNNFSELMIYTYSINYTTQVNCLIEIYNNDLVYTISPIFDQIKTVLNCITDIIDTTVNLNGGYYDAKKFRDVGMTYLDDKIDFAKFKKNYSNQCSVLNRGIIYDIKAINVTDSEYQSYYNLQTDLADNINYPETESGFLNTLMNYHNLALNLILRALYYYNKYNELLNKHLDPNIINTFTKDTGFSKIFNNLVDGFVDPVSNTINLNHINPNVGKNSTKKFISKLGYEKNILTFITTYIGFYTNTLCPLIYKHIRYNMAIMNYELSTAKHFGYGPVVTPGAASDRLNIQKGDAVKQNFLLLTNMLETIKNGQEYISYIYNNYDFIKNANMSYVDIDKNLDYNDITFTKFIDSLNNYLNTVFYFDKSILYGCFSDDNNSNVLNSMDISYVMHSSQKKPFSIGNVNNLDASGEITSHGAMINCVNNTVSYNALNKTKYDIVTLKPLVTDKTGQPGAIDMYTCYAGYSNSFEKSKFIDVNLMSIDKCSVKYTDASGNKNPDYDQNLTDNTVIYQISNDVLDTSNIAHLGCFKRNIPESGIYNTLPHFIYTITSVYNYSSPSDISTIASNLVDNYNSDMGTDYDIFGLTLNKFDNNNIDVYAGSYGFDAKNALLTPADPYGENCNIYFPGIDNFIIFQRKDKQTNKCQPPEVSNLQKYNDALTGYLNKNINLQLKTVLDMGPDIDVLSGLLPIRFNISAIANSKQGSSIIIDQSNNSMDPQSNSSTPGGQNNSRIANLKITVKEGPKGGPGDPGKTGQKGINTVGPNGNIGNAGYWGTTR